MSKIKDTELDWYKFFNDPENPIEYRWDVNPDTSETQIIVWLNCWEIMRFNKEIGNLYSAGYRADEGGINCAWQGNCIAVDFMPLQEYFGLEPERIFPNKD